MKKISILACSLLFISVAAFAKTPQSPPTIPQEALAAILGLPAASSCAAQPNGVREVAKRPAILTGKATCTATCQFGSTVMCSGTTCTGTNASCPSQAGFVTCDSHTTPCPACCTGTNHEIQCCKCDQTGDCTSCCRCDGGSIGQCAIQCS